MSATTLGSFPFVPSTRLEPLRPISGTLDRKPTSTTTNPESVIKAPIRQSVLPSIISKALTPFKFFKDKFFLPVDNPTRSLWKAVSGEQNLSSFESIAVDGPVIECKLKVGNTELKSHIDNSSSTFRVFLKSLTTEQKSQICKFVRSEIPGKLKDLDDKQILTELAKQVNSALSKLTSLDSELTLKEVQTMFFNSVLMSPMLFDSQSKHPKDFIGKLLGSFHRGQSIPCYLKPGQELTRTVSASENILPEDGSLTVKQKDRVSRDKGSFFSLTALSRSLLSIPFEWVGRRDTQYKIKYTEAQLVFVGRVAPQALTHFEKDEEGKYNGISEELNGGAPQVVLGFKAFNETQSILEDYKLMNSETVVDAFDDDQPKPFRRGDLISVIQFKSASPTRDQIESEPALKTVTTKSKTDFDHLIKLQQEFKSRLDEIEQEVIKMELSQRHILEVISGRLEGLVQKDQKERLFINRADLQAAIEDALPDIKHYLYDDQEEVSSGVSSPNDSRLKEECEQLFLLWISKGSTRLAEGINIFDNLLTISSSLTNIASSTVIPGLSIGISLVSMGISIGKKLFHESKVTVRDGGMDGPRVKPKLQEVLEERKSHATRTEKILGMEASEFARKGAMFALSQVPVIGSAVDIAEMIQAAADLKKSIQILKDKDRPQTARRALSKLVGNVPAASVSV